MSGDHTRPEGETAVAEAERPAVHPRSPRQALMPDEMPPPPSRRVRHPFVVVGNAIFTLVVLLIIGGGAALYMGKRKFDATGPLDRERTVMIQRGQGIRDIAEQLRREGVIDQPLLFVIGAALMRVTERGRITPARPGPPRRRAAPPPRGPHPPPAAVPQRRRAHARPRRAQG